MILAVTGSVAAIKTAEVAAALAEFAEVRVVLTDAAAQFVSAEELRAAAGVEAVLTDEDERRAWRGRGDPVLHIELRRWADALVFAPLSANTLAKLAGGLCDNLATCVARAWDLSRPVVAAPAMNTLMWEHPFTARHLAALRDDLGVSVVAPVSRRLECGDTGVGAMAAPAVIADAVRRALRAEEEHGVVSRTP